MHAGQKTRYEVNNVKLKGLVWYLDTTDRRLILCTKITGSWLDVWVTTVTGKVLAAMESYELFCAHYNVTLPNLQSKWNRCGKLFDVCHALSYNKGGLVISSQNKVCDKLLYLAWQSFT